MPRLVEVLLWLTGVVLFLLFVISEWQTVRAQSFAEAALISAKTERPDQRLWSETRIEQFDQAVDRPWPAPLGFLSIPSVAVRVAVFNGTSDDVLNVGAGRIPGTAMPGGGGNLAIAAHRDGFFRGLKDIEAGDEIRMRHRDGTDQYIVTDVRVVEPTDVSVLEPSASRLITLVTCYPFYFVGSAPQRFIVRGELASTTRVTTQQGSN